MTRCLHQFPRTAPRRTTFKQLGNSSLGPITIDYLATVMQKHLSLTLYAIALVLLVAMVQWHVQGMALIYCGNIICQLEAIIDS